MAEESRQKQCKMTPCENLISIRSKFDFCPNCRNRVEFWARRPPTHYLERKLTLQVWANRMDYVREEKRDQYAPYRSQLNEIAMKPEGLPALKDVIHKNRKSRARRAGTHARIQ